MCDKIFLKRWLYCFLLYCFLFAVNIILSPTVFGQIIVPDGSTIHTTDLKPIMPFEPVIQHHVISQEEMDAWPVDKKRSGEKLWAETTWGGDTPQYRKLFNYNIWPNRVVFSVNNSGEVARGEAVWRRSALSIRIEGLKLIRAETYEEIADAVLVQYDQERVIIDFRPISGPGKYYLYYGAAEPPLFNPSEVWLEKAKTFENPVTAKAERIEARCELDSFYPMETTALKSEIERLFSVYPDSPYLVFPQDRDNSIKMLHEIPACWVFRDPADEFILKADRNEYHVFQIGIWACRKNLTDIAVEFTDFTSDSGNSTIPSGLFQCLTLTSNVKSKYTIKPKGPYPVPKGQVRALWCGIDLPENVVSGEYRGSVIITSPGYPPAKVPVVVSISNDIVEERGDHDLWRLSRLRWIESDIGLSDEVFPPFEPLVFSKKARSISTWGHTVVLNKYGMPEKIRFGEEEIIAASPELIWFSGSQKCKLDKFKCDFTEETDGHVSWIGTARSGQLNLQVDGSIEFDGCIVMTLKLDAETECSVDDLTFTVSWSKEHAWLASGMGYRGKRDRESIWRSIGRERSCFDPSIWIGSMKAGMGWKTWDTGPWEDAARMDAATISEQGNKVVMQLNLGTHRIGREKSWQMQFALRPTPVKPPDTRHWQFRYLHRGGGFFPGENDTPQSYLKDNCKRLDELVDLGVKRLNLHDWWGPSFNYAWQWDGPDNLSRLTEEAHKRGIRVKVYNSGRELSTLAPEFWALVYEGTQYRFRDEINTEPRGNFQDAWHENHLPDGLPQGWPRLHMDLGNEHAVPVSNATRNGNFYLESMRYMTENFGTDGAYWDGADGPTLGHREMAKRLWTIFRKTNPEATIDAHHGNTLLNSPMTNYMLVLPFIDSIWHGEGFPYDMFDPWAWLVEISGLPFGIPSEMLSGEQYIDRGMLFGIWPRMGWGAGTEKQQKLWAFFDRFGIEDATMRGWWEKHNGVTVDRPDIYVTAFAHPSNGVLLVVASWHPPLQHWVGSSIDTSLNLDRAMLGIPEGELKATDIMNGEELDILKPVVLRMPQEALKSEFYEYRSLVMPFEGRLIWVRGE